MNKSITMGQTLSLLTAVIAVAICWGAGCVKKSGHEAVPEIPDTLSVTSDTLSKIQDTLSETHDTLLVTHDTLSEISNTFTDTDGQMYKTVTIGKQTWMAENLNYETSSGSWCYGDKPDSCKKYGRLYDWNTAKTVCPSGWHLPSSAEWYELANHVGSPTGRKLKSKTGWNYYSRSYYGTNKYGFSALPGGYRYLDGNYYGVGDYGFWITATSQGSSGTDEWVIQYDYDDAYKGGTSESNGHSVRCVRNRNATGALWTPLY